MSWQTYVDTNLVGTGKIAKAAVLGQQGGVWAASPGFTGVRLAGQKYFTLSADPRSIQSKKGADGAIIVKTKQAILVAVYVGPTQAPEVTPIVEGLADYLISTGY
ncbi:profilin [Pholiota molesta]|nr:profilin [Pholiota molesta]